MSVRAGPADLSGIDRDALAEDITWIPAVDDPIYWSLRLDGLSLQDGTHVPVGKSIVIDSGSTPLNLPKPVLDDVVLKIAGAKDAGRGQYSVPCDTKERIGLRFGGKDFWVQPRDWVGKPVGGGQCLTQITYFHPRDGDDAGIVGDTFFHSQYSAYRLDPLAVGFAPYKDGK